MFYVLIYYFFYIFFFTVEKSPTNTREKLYLDNIAEIQKSGMHKVWDALYICKHDEKQWEIAMWPPDLFT